MTAEVQKNTSSPALAMVVLPQTAWEGLTEEVKAVRNLLQQKIEEEMGQAWIESTQARKMLGVSPKTWQNYRDARKIPFSQFGRKIYVKKADLDAFMEKHYIQAV